MQVAQPLQQLSQGQGGTRGQLPKKLKKKLKRR